MILFHKLDEIKKEVSVILAVRNEEGYIQKCLDSLIKQDFPHEKYEIIVIDGMSDDKTREMLALYRARFPSLVKMFDNPRRTQANGRNIGIRNAEGEIILIFSGHAYAHNQFFSTLIKALNTGPTDIAGVGGIHIPPEDETFIGKVMADVQMSILGGAGTSYRQPRRNAYVDTVVFCAYKKDILERIGLHDEKLDLGEDLELNWRIKKAGFKLMVCPDAISYYYRKHSSFMLLSKRMIKYGIWRAIVTKKHPDSFKIPFSIPVIMVISVTSLPVLIIFYPLLADVILLGLTLYIIAILTSSLYLLIKRRSIKYLISAPIYVIEHFSIGFGFIVGLFTKLPKN
jgi:glycosyltransferase involved in cell wall biosynthesis